MTDGAGIHRLRRTAAIVGGGVAGLASALALAGVGFDVDVFERAEHFSEVGAGLQLSPNATRILKRLGVLERLMDVALQTHTISLLSARSGQLLLDLSTSDPAQADGVPFLAVHRADLQSALLDTVRSVPGIAIRTGQDFQSAQEKSGKIEAVFLEGDAVRTTDADLLVGADGVWSTVRRYVSGHSTTRHSGYTAWRATVPVDSNLPAALAGLVRSQSVGAFLSPGAHLVVYPLRKNSILNLVLVTPGTDQAQGWDNPVDLSLFSQTLGQFEPSLRNFLASVTQWRSWPLHGCPPEGAWTSGRIALVGDAAHAMTPFAAQGACMAIEDVAVLASCLSGTAHIPSALAAFETLRKPRVSKVIARGRFNRFAYHVSGPAALARNAVFALCGQSLMRELDWLYGFDAAKV